MNAQRRREPTAGTSWRAEAGESNKVIAEKEDDFTDGAQFYLHPHGTLFEDYLYDLIRRTLADHE